MHTRSGLLLRVIVHLAEGFVADDQAAVRVIGNKSLFHTFEGVQEDAGVVYLVRVHCHRQQFVIFEMEISFVLQFYPSYMVNILRAPDPRSTPLLSRLAKFSRIARITLTSL